MPEDTGNRKQGRGSPYKGKNVSNHSLCSIPNGYKKEFINMNGNPVANVGCYQARRISHLIKIRKGRFSMPKKIDLLMEFYVDKGTIIPFEVLLASIHR